MVQSLNKKVDLVTEGTSFMGMNEYGKIMIGDEAFEFYNERDTRKYIQIPWSEVNKVIASVMFKGKWIPRFAIETKQYGLFTFAAKDAKGVLRHMQPYVLPEKMVRSLSFWQVVKRGFSSKNKK